MPLMPAKAGHPVRRGFSINRNRLGVLDHPLFAGDDSETASYSRLIAVTSLPAALIRAIASRVFSITVAM